MLKDMVQLTYLNLAKNKIKALTVFTQEDLFPNLKWLDVSNNKITDMPAFKLPKLEYLDISYNKLDRINDLWAGHANIRVFKSVDNKFKALSQFKAMPKLEQLYLANNMITALTGWDGMPALKKLHLRRNKVEKIDEELIPLESLEYINLRGNKIANMETLERIYKNPNCLDINVLNNPIETSASSFNILLADCLVKNPKLKRFCKVEITETHKLEAVYLGQYKWGKKEEERKRKLKEDAAKNPDE